MLALQILAAGGSVSVDGRKILNVAGVAGRGVPMTAVQDNVLPTTDNLDNARALVELKKGPHALQIDASGTSESPLQVRLAWLTPQQRQVNYTAAIDAARRASKAVVFVWGRDRPAVFALPGDQDKLVSDIAAVNRNTIVVLNTSLPVAMPWLSKVKAVVQMWWPGDEGGPATANILTGRANPAGRLPITWPVSLDQMVTNDPAHPERVSRGVDGKTSYTEGLFMGYRWFDKQDLQPLFPFGHGLSYASFEYSDLKTARGANGALEVTFNVRNAGRSAGDEVPQVYLGSPQQAPAGVQFAVRALAGFDRVALQSGENKTVTISVSARALQYWSSASDRWATATGSRTVYVGASSRDMRLQADAIIN
jgi:beta-glucosidase